MFSLCVMIMGKRFEHDEITTLEMVIVMMVGLFISSCLVSKMKNKNCPMIWPVMGIIPTWAFHTNDGYHWLTKSLIRAGGSFRYRGMWMGGLYGIITADPSSVEYILKTNFTNFPKGKYYRERFFDLLGDGIFNADGATWKEQRRAATAEMHTPSFTEYSFRSIQDLVSRKLLDVLGKAAGTRRRVDLQDILLRFTFDNICVAAFGVDPGCLTAEVAFAKAFEEATELTTLRFLTPPFVWKTMRFFKVGSEKRLEFSVKIIREFAEDIVAKRKADLLFDGLDLLTRLVKNGYLDEQGEKVCFPDKILRDFCVSFILAGRDTSSVGLAWFFWLIYHNPDVETGILDELTGIISNREFREDRNDVVFTSDELTKKTPFLHAAISESLRLFPPVAVDLKEVLEDDVLPNGTRLEKGSRVIYSIFSMARRESIWGKDCLEFKPGRWLKDGKFVCESSFKYPVFNAGPRLCVGKKFAFLQMKMVAAAVLWRYRVKVVEGHKVVPKITTTLYMKHGLMVSLEPRIN